jgi:putative membrane protein
MRSRFRSLRYPHSNIGLPVFLKIFNPAVPNESARTSILTGIAVLLHIIGIIGVVIFESRFFSDLTIVHLLIILAFFLLAYSGQCSTFLLWCGITYVLAFIAEWIGVYTGLLFGNYIYRPGLGFTVFEVPLLIGLSWIIVGCGAISLAQKFTTIPWQVNLLASLFAVIYDWFLEPVAIKFDYWEWGTGFIPLWNYICWALFIYLLSMMWQLFKLKSSRFAANFFMIQIIYFLILTHWL